MSDKTTRRKLGEIRDDRTDWKRLDGLTEAYIARAIKDDPDTFEVNRDWFQQAMVLRPTQDEEPVTVRLDSDMLAWSRRQGRGYQTRINAILRGALRSAS